jgi:DNA modification methylase
MFSVKGDLVLDPFLGSGTTIKAAMQNDRSSFGYEIDESLIPLIKATTIFNEVSGKATIVTREPA